MQVPMPLSTSVQSEEAEDEAAPLSSGAVFAEHDARVEIRRKAARIEDNNLFI